MSMKLPKVWPEGFMSHYRERIQQEAAKRFRLLQLPNTLGEWDPQSLRKRLWQSFGVKIDHSLDLDFQVTGEHPMPGCTVKNVYYQSRTGFYVTGNLYIPNGNGPFPGILHMHGHDATGHLTPAFANRCHILAQRGYVVLCVDAFGSGERAIRHGQFEYHGWNLGGALFQFGETLMGVQVVDNMRGIDLLCSLPFVDPEKIGATGSSGGGNQTMWLAAMDERVKAAVPVISGGTFESYLHSTNCVCELLPNGLCYTEEAGIFALVAPRALLFCNGLLDRNPAFNPLETKRSADQAAKIFNLMGVRNNLETRNYNQPHCYGDPMRAAMLGWFDFHLKGLGHGGSVELPNCENLSEDELLVFTRGTRSKKVKSIPGYCAEREAQIAITRVPSVEGVRQALRLPGIHVGEKPLTLVAIHQHSASDGWQRFTLEGNDGRLIPLLLRAPKSGNRYVICSTLYGKNAFDDPVPGEKRLVQTRLWEQLESSGNGLAVIDVQGSGENDETTYPGTMNMKNYSRWLLWLGRTMQGEWVGDYQLAAMALERLQPGCGIGAGGFRDTAIAALCFAALQNNATDLWLDEAPESFEYAPERANKFDLDWLIPGILNAADISDLRKMVSGKIYDIAAKD